MLKSSKNRTNVKVAVESQSRPKKVILGPRYVGGGVSQISDMRFQITLTSDHVADFRSVPLSDLGDQAAKKRRKKEETRVKYKYADILCRAA